MHRNIPAGKLAGVAKSIADLAEPLWGHYARETFTAIMINGPSPVAAHIPAFASEFPPRPACAGDGSAVEMDRHG
jgi:hypothetical protein